MFKFFRNISKSQTRRKTSKKIVESLSSQIVNSREDLEKIKEIIKSCANIDNHKKEIIVETIEGWNDGIEELVGKYNTLLRAREKQKTRHKKYQRYLSFVVFFISIIIIYFISFTIIGNPQLSQSQPTVQTQPIGLIFSIIQPTPLTFSIVVGALLGIFPISFIAYSFYKSEVQKERLENDLRLLGLVSEENIDEINELYNTVYNPWQFAVYILLLMVVSSIIFAAYYYTAVLKDELLFIPRMTVKIIFYAFLGAYFFGIQLIVRRYNTFDLQPQVYSAVILRTLLSAVITFSIASLIGGIVPGTSFPIQDNNDKNPKSQVNESGAESSQAVNKDAKSAAENSQETDKNTLPWQVLAFLIGIFPNRGIRWISFVTTRAFNAPIEQYNEYPLKNIAGINTWHEARLSELGIDNVQSLATTDMCKLLLSTQFDTQQVVNWIDQAILCMKVGTKIDRFREININTFHELKITLNESQKGRNSKEQQDNANDSQTKNGNNSCEKQDNYKRLSSALGLVSDEDMYKLSNDSNYPNYAHIYAYYKNAPDVAKKQAASGKQFVMNSLSKQFTIGGILIAQNEDEGEEVTSSIRLDSSNQKIVEAEIEALEARLEDYPNNAKVYVELGTRYYLINQKHKARRQYERAIQLEANLAEAYNNRSVIYLDSKDDPKAIKNAIKDIFKALQINPHFAEAYSNRGLAELRQNNLFAALTSFNKALEINPRLAAAYYIRGVVYNTISVGENDFKAAVADFERAYLLGYDNVVLWSAWGLALSMLGNYKEAIGKYDIAIALSNIPSVRLYAQRGYAYLQLGTNLYMNRDVADSDKSEAASCYRQANYDFNKAINEISNAPPTTYSNYGLLKAREADRKVFERKYNEAILLYQEAIKQYNEAINSYEKDAGYEDNSLDAVYINLAKANQKLGELQEKLQKDAQTAYKAAIENYQRAIERGDDTVGTHFNYSVCFFTTNNFEEALKQFNLIKGRIENRQEYQDLYKIIKDYIAKIETKISQITPINTDSKLE